MTEKKKLRHFVFTLHTCIDMYNTVYHIFRHAHVESLSGHFDIILKARNKLQMPFFTFFACDSKVSPERRAFMTSPGVLGGGAKKKFTIFYSIPRYIGWYVQMLPNVLFSFVTNPDLFVL